jgi:hypothetical protein
MRRKCRMLTSRIKPNTSIKMRQCCLLALHQWSKIKRLTSSSSLASQFRASVELARRKSFLFIFFAGIRSAFLAEFFVVFNADLFFLLLGSCFWCRFFLAFLRPSSGFSKIGKIYFKNSFIRPKALARDWKKKKNCLHAIHS